MIGINVPETTKETMLTFPIGYGSDIVTCLLQFSISELIKDKFIVGCVSDDGRFIDMKFVDITEDKIVTNPIRFDIGTKTISVARNSIEKWIFISVE